MKSKELKVLRKKLEKLHRIDNVLDGVYDSTKDGKYPLLASSLVESESKKKDSITIQASSRNNHKNNTNNDENNNTNNNKDDYPKETATDILATKMAAVSTSTENDRQDQRITIQYMSSADLQKQNNSNSSSNSDLLQSCLTLFETNMGKLYQESSWGLSMEDKQNELCHKHARFLLLFDGNDNSKNDNNDDAKKQQQFIGFCHFRFDWNDDEFPTGLVLYLYEIQIMAEYQNYGIGSIVMQLLERIGCDNKVQKVMLTVFKQNKQAMNFYLQKLRFGVDETSPSEHGENADYEILSKRI